MSDDSGDDIDVSPDGLKIMVVLHALESSEALHDAIYQIIEKARVHNMDGATLGHMWHVDLGPFGTYHINVGINVSPCPHSAVHATAEAPDDLDEADNVATRH